MWQHCTFLMNSITMRYSAPISGESKDTPPSSSGAKARNERKIFGRREDEIEVYVLIAMFSSFCRR